ncbi:MAG: TldD/PmbA family protein [Clostridia bacterium]|nr:TldD/PmbA family protein [Clostridia bacterium]
MLNDILASKKELFADDAQTVLRGHENRMRRVTLLKGNLVGNARSSSAGISARVSRNGVHGFASAGEYTEEAAETVLRKATENAAFLASHGGRNLASAPAQRGGYVPYGREIIDLEQKRAINLCKEIDDHIAVKYPDLTSRTVVYTEDSQDKIIYTSDAFDGRATYPRCYIYVFMNSETKDGVPVEVFRPFGGLGCIDDWFSDLTPLYEGIEKLYSQLCDKKNGVYADAGYKTVVLGGMMTGMLSHEAVGHTVEADLVLGGSVAGRLLGQRVASEMVTLTDFAYEAFGRPTPLPVYIDDEGTKASDAVLIRDGILTGYMHSRESAQHFGVGPTGNARAWAFGDEPLIRMRNTCILPGKDSLEDMISSVDDGYYLIDSSNGQADLTGEFMFGVSMGYEIKNGKLGRALLDTTVTGVAFEMLRTVDMVSKDVTWSSSGFCGKKQPMPVGMGGPALRCKIMIGGR